MIPIINNDEAEMSVIGSIIIDNLCLQELELTEKDFFNNTFKIIFACILQLKKENIPVDIITLHNKLMSIKQLEKIGGISYLMDITDNTPTSSNFISYQQIVKNYSLKNKLFQLLNESKNILHNDISIAETINNIYKGLSDIEKNINTDTQNLFELLETTATYIQQIKTKDLIGHSFGENFKFLDTISGGLERGKIYRIGGGSNVGKSWLLYNLLINLLSFTDKITFFSLENENQFTMKNLLCHLKGVNPRNDLIKKYNYDFSNEYNFFMEKTNFCLTNKYRNLFDILRLALKNKSEFIFIDFIQLIEIPGNFKGDTEKYNFYSKEIQKFASKYNVGVIDLSQLSNDTQRSGIDGNGNTEFKGGGSLKESCDFGIHLFKNKDLEEIKEMNVLRGIKTEFNKNYVKMLISKNRLGPGVGSVHNFEIDFNLGGKYIKNKS